MCRQFCRVPLWAPLIEPRLLPLPCPYHPTTAPPQSLFDAKGMAGNIIHAIATTNAIISGLIVTEALKILAGAWRCVEVYHVYTYDTPG